MANNGKQETWTITLRSFNGSEYPLTLSELEHVSKQISEGYTSGELCFISGGGHGWWELKKRSKNNE